MVVVCGIIKCDFRKFLINVFRDVSFWFAVHRPKYESFVLTDDVTIQYRRLPNWLPPHRATAESEEFRPKKKERLCHCTENLDASC